MAGLKFFTINTKKNATVTHEMFSIWRTNGIRYILQKTFLFQQLVGKDYSGNKLGGGEGTVTVNEVNSVVCIDSLI